MDDLIGVTETGQDLVLGSVDGRIDGRISQGIFSSFSTAEYGDQLREVSQGRPFRTRPRIPDPEGRLNREEAGRFQDIGGPL